MRKNSHWVRFLLLGVILLVFGWVVGCGGEKATPTPTKPGVVATPTPVKTPPPAGGVQSATVTELISAWGSGLFDPARTSDTTLHYTRMLHAYLVESDGTGGGLLPGIAKSWEMSPDAKAWTFTIRDGVKAHNGEEINVDDVYGNLEDHYGVAGKVRAAAGTLELSAPTRMAKNTKSVEKVAPDKVRITMNAATPGLAWEFSSSPSSAIGMMLPMDYWNQVGMQGYEAKPVGTGPFKLVSFTPSQEIVFERFDDYYYQPKNGFPEDRRPKFNRLVQRLVPEAATRAAALQAGQADLIQANLYMLEDIKKAGGKVVYAQESAYLRYHYTDCWDPKLYCFKKEVRQALEYAIDKETLIKQLYGPGVAVAKGWSHVTPNSLGYLAGVTDPYPYDVTKAKQLLAQAGFPDGKGMPVIQIYAWIDESLPLVPELAQAIAAGWKKQLGVNAEVVVGDPVSVRERLATRQLPGAIEFRSNETRYDGTSATYSKYVLNPLPAMRVCDASGPGGPRCLEIEKLVKEKMSVPGDLATRNKNFQEVYTVLRDESHMGGILYANSPWGLGARVKDYKPWTMASYTTAIWTLELK